MDDFTKKIMALMFAAKGGESGESENGEEGGEEYGKMHGCGKAGCPMKNGGWETTKARLKAAGMEDDEFEWLSP